MTVNSKQVTNVGMKRILRLNVKTKSVYKFVDEKLIITRLKYNYSLTQCNYIFH